MNLRTNISRVYFIGIGGIGMSALVRYFMHRNATVSGYDKTPSEITTTLQQEGAKIHFEDSPDLLDQSANLVIYTPAVPADHKELVWYKSNGYTVKKRSEVLADITADGYNVCIAGTHGKTTMSTMTAYILRESGIGCNAFLGGISVNYNTNYWGSDSRVNVVEADEYDKSFLRLFPDIAVISAMDPDHLDIYGDVEKMRDAYHSFAGQVRNGGLLLIKFGLTMKRDLSQTTLTYSLQNEGADVKASHIVMEDGGYHFSVSGPGWSVKDLRLEMGGMHNVENAVVAVSVAQRLGVSDDLIRKSIASFRGVRRRFEYIINARQAKEEKTNVVFIDDYAHHPEELRALLRSARSLFNDRWMTVIFQPHLYSRTRDLYREFAEVLSIANQVILLPIYPARELPIEGVTSGLIAHELKDTRVSIIDSEKILSWMDKQYVPSLPHSISGDVLITAGAGNIDRLVNPIKEKLLNH